MSAWPPSAAVPNALRALSAKNAWHYAEGRRLSRRGRVLAAGSVLALHGGAWLALLGLPPQVPAPEPAAPVVSLRLISAAPVSAAPPPASPALPAPKPERRVIATPRATDSPIRAIAAEPEAQPAPQPDPQPEAPSAVTSASPAPSAAASSPASEATRAPAQEPSVVPPDYVAAYLDNPAPPYPRSAKAQRETGRVLLRVRVSREGRAQEVRVEQSSGHVALDDAARGVVERRWRFVPAKRGDEPIEAWVLIPFDFTLR